MIRAHAAAIAFAALSAMAVTDATAQQVPANPRPRDSTANLPSDSGSQTVQPGGAVTGAGHPQGTGIQPDVGQPGGLERRARAQERQNQQRRATAAGAGAGAMGATAAGASAGMGARTGGGADMGGTGSTAGTGATGGDAMGGGNTRMRARRGSRG